jgi:DNA topoisomerase II
MTADTTHNIKIKTFKEHVQTRSMWMGSDRLASHPFYIVDTANNTIITKKIVISDALIKTADELIVNCIDQYTLGKCTEISFSYKTVNNQTVFTIINKGSSMPIGMIEINGVQRHIVEILFTEQFSSMNFEDNVDQITGGVNGLGLKLVSLNSKIMSVETCDGKQIYKQNFINGNDIIEPPSIVPIHGGILPYTKISYVPNYEVLCKDSVWHTEQINIENFIKIIEFRFYQTSLFINSVPYKHVNNTLFKFKPATIIFNKKKINITLDIIAKMFKFQDYHIIDYNNPSVNKFPWKILIASNPFTKYESMSVINGISIKDSSHISSLIVKPLFQMSEKKKPLNITEVVFKNTLFIISCQNIPLAGFSSQSKKEFQLSRTTLKNMKEEFKIKSGDFEKIWAYLLFRLSKKEKILINIEISEKYVKAQKLGKNSILFLPEGDSAASPIKEIIYQSGSCFKKEYCGIYNINGIPLNVLKHTKTMENEHGEKLQIYSEILKKNKTLQGLTKVLGLTYGKKEVDFSKLNYGCVMLATDEDTDGKGQITGLLCAYFSQWPELFVKGVVKRITTPIIRLYWTEKKERKSIDFYSHDEFNEYCSKNKLKSNVDVQYYKGLATHTDKEVKKIGREAINHVYTFVLSPDCLDIMEKYYGKSTTCRKQLLQDDTVHKYDVALYKENKLQFGEYLNIETKEFQLYFIVRKIKSSVDGLNMSQRKALASARKHPIKVTKVYQISGQITTDMAYQHGDKSINDTVIKSAQSYVGTNNIPLFIGISNGFGNRCSGRHKTGSPRYLLIKYNKAMDLLFPPEDDCHLEYVYEENQKCEPKYYIPIIPYSITETLTSPGAGWKSMCYARSFDDVFKRLIETIDNKYSDTKLEHWIRNEKYPINYIISNNKDISYGSYEIKDNKLFITQLPYKVWNDQFKKAIINLFYCEQCIKGENHDCTPAPVTPVAVQTSPEQSETRVKLIKDYADYTSDNEINIIITLTDFKMLEFIKNNYKVKYLPLDPIIEFFKIYTVLTHNLNLLGVDNRIIEFSSYEDIFDGWFSMRRDLYMKRLERKEILLKLTIEYKENMYKFLEMDMNGSIDINKKTHKERYEILENNKFTKFNLSNLTNNKEISNALLYEKIMVTNASYTYIDDIKVKHRAIEELQSLDKEITKYKELLGNLPTWQNLWKDELNIFRALVLARYAEQWKDSL